VRRELRRLAAQAGVRRRFAPHQLRHAHAVELAREGVPLNVIQRQLGHSNLGVTSTYLQGIDNAEVINAVHRRRPPMIPAAAGLMLETDVMVEAERPVANPPRAAIASHPSVTLLGRRRQRSRPVSEAIALIGWHGTIAR
jgi:hypothetical protein